MSPDKIDAALMGAALSEWAMLEASRIGRQLGQGRPWRAGLAAKLRLMVEAGGQTRHAALYDVERQLGIRDAIGSPRTLPEGWNGRPEPFL